jgi:hypothetical protein
MAKEKEKDPTVTGWLNTIASYEKDFKKWEARVDKILKRYRDDNRSATTSTVTSKFNILWSNVQVAVPAVFSRLPKPDVSRRFNDNDPIGRVAALILERALEYEIEHYSNYRSSMVNCVQDRFLGGRGLAWVRYEPHFKDASLEDGLEITEDTDEETHDVLDYECAPVDYVHWKDFGHTIARTWEEVTGVWRKVYMGREALVERFGEELGEKIPLDTKPEGKKESSDKNYEACIYEIWDKEEGKAYWLSKAMPDLLDEKDDPLGLDEFWPCPRPLYATLTTDSLIPVPDFTLYQDQANALDILCDRVDGLIKALQVKGVYDAAIPELKRLLTEGENNTLIGVSNWTAFSEKNGLKGAIDLIDLQPIFQALEAAYGSMEQQKNQIYEITGLSDILRASTDPNETASAQKLKGQFGSMRLRTMQNSVAQFATDLLKIKAQIICKQFDPQTLMMIGDVKSLSQDDQQFIEPAIQLLKGGTSSLRIEVEADSLVMMDENQEKDDRVAFLTASASFLKEAVEAGQQSPELIPLMGEMLKFGVSGFKVGKTIEGSFDTFIDQAKLKAKQDAENPQPKPDPEMMKIQAQSQMDQQTLQMKAQADQQQAQMDFQIEQQKTQLQMQLEEHKQQLQAQQIQAQNQIEAQREAQNSQHEAALKQMEMQQANHLAQQQMSFDKYKAELDASTKIIIAEIAAQTQANAQQLQAESDAAQKVDQDLGGEKMDKMAKMHTDAMGKITEAMQAIAKPKTIVRGEEV